MTGKKIFKNLVSQLTEISTKTFEKHAQDAIKKQKALVQYKRMQYMKSGKTLSPEEDAELVKSVGEQLKVTAPQIETRLLEQLNRDDLNKVEHEHLTNIITFLKSQQEYIELLERYNPGLVMKQDDNVRKSARMVGLELPESK
ncbi:hypothetical protein CANARDRAFT_26113 [[Candida] arabinofermentans NRRL YB-2248]|uniref:ATP synthase assembly factor FMC1, mitochondrial n=1 Tax=[Candida] arabinofermentans NRRL YB-2248 TaxID=983967 RepID=A0A1E4T8F8_9ASCO|nr:hypothetical protein CANARDRAFT_26113 [[Candida] arabinofermentans NRRL YB-2248]